MPTTYPSVRTLIRFRADDDPGRADVVGEAGDFVHGDEIEVSTGADGSSSGIGQTGLSWREEGS